MGVIASTANMPSAKFVNPANGATIPANTNFTVQMAISHLETGHFVNANENYFSAPQVVNSAGDIQGHSHVVIEALTSLDQTAPTDPSKFTFFKGLNDPAQNGVLSAEVAGGLPAGVYRIASINSAANHQPVLVAIAQHGSLDDMAYFTVSDSGAAATGKGAAAGAGAAKGGNGAAAGTAAAAAASKSAAAASAAAAKATAAKGTAGKGAAAAKGGKKGRFFAPRSQGKSRASA
ncbi:hypothetical protein C2E23DRAFT_810931 [Lenzites betulinus]|nr:hypothetical protein C2E23DRAFT_810931 [Lenzites betulinus]